MIYFPYGLAIKNITVIKNIFLLYVALTKASRDINTVAYSRQPPVIILKRRHTQNR